MEHDRDHTLTTIEEDCVDYVDGIGRGAFHAWAGNFFFCSEAGMFAIVSDVSL